MYARQDPIDAREDGIDKSYFKGLFEEIIENVVKPSAERNVEVYMAQKRKEAIEQVERKFKRALKRELKLAIIKFENKAQELVMKCRIDGRDEPSRESLNVRRGEAVRKCKDDMADTLEVMKKEALMDVKLPDFDQDKFMTLRETIAQAIFIQTVPTSKFPHITQLRVKN